MLLCVKNLRGIVMEDSRDVSIGVEIVLAADWIPAPGEECWTPNLMEPKGAPLCFAWDGTHTDYHLLISRRIHKKETQAYQQQVSLQRLLYAVLAG
jgi:hypothetical protein